MDQTTYLVIGPHYYGHATDIATAKRNLTAAGGALSRGYIVLEFPPGIEFVGVDDMGYYEWKNTPETRDVRPVEIKRVSPRR